MGAGQSSGLAAREARIRDKVIELYARERGVGVNAANMSAYLRARPDTRRRVAAELARIRITPAGIKIYDRLLKEAMRLNEREQLDLMRSARAPAPNDNSEGNNSNNAKNDLNLGKEVEYLKKLLAGLKERKQRRSASPAEPEPDLLGFNAYPLLPQAPVGRPRPLANAIRGRSTPHTAAAAAADVRTLSPYRNHTAESANAIKLNAFFAENSENENNGARNPNQLWPIQSGTRNAIIVSNPHGALPPQAASPLSPQADTTPPSQGLLPLSPKSPTTAAERRQFASSFKFPRLFSRPLGAAPGFQQVASPLYNPPQPTPQRKVLNPLYGIQTQNPLLPGQLQPGGRRTRRKHNKQKSQRHKSHRRRR